MTAEGVVKNFCTPLDMAEKITKRLRDVVDLLESAVEEKDWGLVEEALDELRSIVDELEE
jgi:exonuclease VII small subunit